MRVQCNEKIHKEKVEKNCFCVTEQLKKWKVKEVYDINTDEIFYSGCKMPEFYRGGKKLVYHTAGIEQTDQCYGGGAWDTIVRAR